MRQLLVLSSIVVLLAWGEGCEEKIYPTPIVSLLTQGAAGAAPCASAGAPVTRTVPPPVCQGRCCPKDPGCYALGNPSMHSGAECLAMRDNTNQPRWQLRQTFSVSTKPPGLAAPPIPDFLAHRSELPSATCSASMGLGGFIQLVDFDTVGRVSRTGFAKFAATEADAVTTGLCFVEDDAYTTDHALPAVYAPPAGWPPGLPPPMAMPWKVVPSTAVQIDQDFTLPDDRKTLLARLTVGGDLYGKGSGVFYFDKTQGYMHGYSPVTYIVNYDSATSYVVVPIREAEMTQWLNDPAYPNCSGVFLGDNSAVPDTCVGDATNRLWGCPPGNCAAGESTPTKVQGYFLIAELEQLTSLGQTLCSLFAAGMYQSWAMPDKMSCRSNPNWNALDPVSGLPAGDWCATTNDRATATCHDAWQSISFSTFQAFPIKDGTCAPL